MITFHTFIAKYGIEASTFIKYFYIPPFQHHALFGLLDSSSVQPESDIAEEDSSPILLCPWWIVPIIDLRLGVVVAEDDRLCLCTSGLLVSKNGSLGSGREEIPLPLSLPSPDLSDMSVCSFINTSVHDGDELPTCDVAFSLSRLRSCNEWEDDICRARMAESIASP